jgi:hypothetical protein
VSRREPLLTVDKDGVAWQVGTEAEVAWIAEGSAPGWHNVGIPPVFAACATVVVPDGAHDKLLSDTALLRVLTEHSPPQPWWLGYLDTGVADVVFPHAPMVSLYSGWPYVLVEAGPDQAATWRTGAAITPWHSALPELIFPADRSWLVSTLWDDDWRCVGGSAGLVDALVRHPDLEARPVAPGEDPTPPGHEDV